MTNDLNDGWRPPASRRTIPAISERRLNTIVTIIVTIIAAALRLPGLGTLQKLLFDETYYVKDAYAIHLRGYELDWAKNPHVDAHFAAGNFQDITDKAAFVVHPPLGKWLISLGMDVAGPTHAYSWRIVVAVFGIVAVFLVMRLAWHLFHSALLTGIAGLFLATDTLHLSMSRIGLLDGLLATFILAACVTFVRDQQSYRARTAARFISLRRQLRTVSWIYEGEAPPLPGTSAVPDVTSPAMPDAQATSVFATAPTVAPANDTPTATVATSAPHPATPATPTGRTYRAAERFPFRPWLIATGALLGMAAAVKWSTLYMIAVLGIFLFIRELTLRYQARIPSRYTWSNAIIYGGIPAFIYLVITAFVTYIVCWLPWFMHPKAWGHGQAAKAGIISDGSLWEPLVDWALYQRQVFQFHIGVTSPHTYQSTPLQWLFNLRPTSMVYEKSTVDGTKMTQAMLAIGNPALWWCALVGLIFIVVAAVAFREWRAGMILCGYLGLWAPWLYYSYVDDRTIFMFYMVVLSPFVALATTYLIGLLFGTIHPLNEPLEASAHSMDLPTGYVPRWSIAFGIVLIVVILACAIFFLPLATGWQIPVTHWRWRMWLPSWI